MTYRRRQQYAYVARDSLNVLRAASVCYDVACDSTGTVVRMHCIRLRACQLARPLRLQELACSWPNAGRGWSELWEATPRGCGASHCQSVSGSQGTLPLLLWRSGRQQGRRPRVASAILDLADAKKRGSPNACVDTKSVIIVAVWPPVPLDRKPVRECTCCHCY